MDTAIDEGLRALEERRGFVRPTLLAVAVRGADAERWLNDLVTAGVAGLARGQSARSLILTPTGRIRADVHVLWTGDAFVLVQSSDQPEAAEAILAPYVLSSAVELGAADGKTVLLPADGGWRVAVETPPGTVEVGAAAAERWRVERGIARFPIDLDGDSLPAEAGLDVPPVTDTSKGCFLGQESVARVRNLGHPTRVVRPLEADHVVAAGEEVTAGGRAVGVVTSAAERADGSSAVLARIRWDARDRELVSAGGVPLRRR